MHGFASAEPVPPSYSGSRADTPERVSLSIRLKGSPGALGDI
jgi:hypothetical protein